MKKNRTVLIKEKNYQRNILTRLIYILTQDATV